MCIYYAYCLILLTLLFWPSQSTVSYVKKHRLVVPTNSPPLQIHSCIVNSYGFTMFFMSSSQQSTCIIGNPSSGLPFHFVQKSNVLPVSHTLLFRQFETNYVNITQSYLFILNNSIHYTKNLFTLTQIIYNATSSETFVDMMFGPSISQYFFIVNDTFQGKYKLVYQNKTTNIKKLLTLDINHTYIRSVKNNGHIFMLFKQGILTHSANSSMNYIEWIPFYTLSVLPQISVNLTLMVYSNNNTFHLFQTANGVFVQIFSYTLLTNIQGLALTQNFVIANSHLLITQHDIKMNGACISSIAYNKTNQFMQLVLGQFLYFTTHFPTPMQSIDVYQSSYKYPWHAVLGQCVPGYFFDPLTSDCVRNFSYNGAWNVSVMAIQNEINKYFTINISNSTQNNIIIQPNLEKTQQKYNKDISISLSYGLGRVMTFSSSRLSPKFLLNFVQYLDDLWYYKHHRVQYPPSAQYFMQRIDIINELRLNPWFLRSLEQPKLCQQENDIYSQLISKHENNPQEVYFSYASQDTYKMYLIFNLISYLAIKLAQIGIFTLRHKSRLLLQAALWIGSNSRWWTFITIMLQSNMMNLTFQSVLQICIGGSLQFKNKLNLLFSIITLFSLVLYSVLFYPFVYQFCHRLSAETLLIKCIYKMSSFFVESFSLVCRNFFRSFIHAFLMQNYKQQIIMLAVSDLMCSVLCYHFRKKFTNLFFFTLFLGYNIVFFILDLCFYVHCKDESIFAGIDYNTMILVWMCLLIVLSLLLSLSILYILINQSVKKMLASQFKANDIAVVELKQKQNIHNQCHVFVPVQHNKINIGKKSSMESIHKLNNTQVQNQRTENEQNISQIEAYGISKAFKVIFDEKCEIQQQSVQSFQQLKESACRANTAENQNTRYSQQKFKFPFIKQKSVQVQHNPRKMSRADFKNLKRSIKLNQMKGKIEVVNLITGTDILESQKL